MNNRTPGDFLICHPGALGDFILAWPVLIGLRKILPGYRFMGIGRAQYMRLAQRFGLIDGFTDGESSECIGFFAGESLPPGIEQPAGGVLWIKNGEAVLDLIQESASMPVVIIDPAPKKTVHAALGYYQTVQKQYPLELPKKLSDLYPKNNPPDHLAIIHPGSGSEKKNYAPELYKGIADLLRKKYGWKKVTFVMGPAEIDRELPQFFTGEELIFPTDVMALADYLENASLYIGNDSGVSHLAGYLGTPSIVLYKTTDPNVWGVIGKKVHHLSAPNEENALRKLSVIIEKWT